MTAFTAAPHSVTIENRQRAELSGIQEVESFDERGVVLHSTAGEITVDGEDLKIDSFSVDSGRVVITGTIDALIYQAKPRARRSFFSRRAE